MRVIKRDIRDIENRVNDKLYCINDEGTLIYSLRDHRWSCTVEGKKEFDNMPAWALNNPYENHLMEDDLVEVMKEMYDVMQESVKVKNKSIEMER